MKQKVKISLLSTLFLLGILMSLPWSAIAAPVLPSDFLGSVDLTGELRIRYENIEKDVPDEDAIDRLRAKFLMGLKWNNPDENWRVAAGLATGGADGRSTNATYSSGGNTFETGDIRLDYAYAEHTMDNFKFLAGQQKNPYATTWAMWDSDLRPAGFTAIADYKPVFVTTGWYQVRYAEKLHDTTKTYDIADLVAIQAGTKLEMVTAALAYYHYNQVNDYIDFAKLKMDSDYTYQIIDLYVKGDIPTDSAKIAPYMQVFYNMGAEGEAGQSIVGGDLDPEEENMGWLVGVDAKIDKFKFGIGYAQIGADSVQQNIKDSDFGSQLNETDVKGFKIGLGYALTKNCSLDGTAYLYEAMERDIDQDPTTYHLDLNYKF